MPDRYARRDVIATAAVALLGLGGLRRAQADEMTTLTVFAAGTLAKPLRAFDEVFQAAHPDIAVQPQFGGSVKMVKQITELGEIADVVAAADYSVIPKYMFGGVGRPAFADWYAGFAGNAITFMYTPRSKFAAEITPENWHDVLARPGVQIGRSNPDTDPSGYQILLMLKLAEIHYQRPGLAERILANAPETNVRDTETELIPALQSGQIDYLGIYRSDAIQLGLDYVKLPPQVNLSDPRYASLYARASVETKNGTITGKPIVYAVTIPTNAAHARQARAWIAALLSSQGSAIMARSGFAPLRPAYVSDPRRIPVSLRSLVRSWPKG